MKMNFGLIFIKRIQSYQEKIGDDENDENDFNTIGEKKINNIYIKYIIFS